MKKKRSMARYQEIAQIMLTDISEGTWKVGDQLPSEQALSEQFDVSRFTIRSALDDLQERGMISRRRRLGTVVISTKPVELIVQEIHSVDELFQYPENTKREVLQTLNLVPDVSLANFMQCDVGSQWIKIETVRKTHKQIAVCLSEIYVPRAYKNVRDLVTKTSKPVFKIIEEHFAVEAVEINAEVLAGSVSQERASLLGVEPNSASLIMVRRYRDAKGKLIEVSVSEHPASRFTYSFNLSYKR
ncbi:MAG: GntR family transcriptional regulator [Porticoccaceae bacterium]|nr:GntR family transcriptional regulator [Porticoccaceae bacterium]